MLGTNLSDGATISQQKLCYYSNRTPKVQVGLITNIPGQRVEQVLFPGQRWMFWATPRSGAGGFMTQITWQKARLSISPVNVYR